MNTLARFAAHAGIIAAPIAAIIGGNEALRVYYQDCTAENACVILPLSREMLRPKFSDAQLDDVVATVIGEVRGQDRPEEVAAVTDVIYNRLVLGAWGDTFSDVVHYSVKGRHAFSTWNVGDPSYTVVTKPGVAHDPRYKHIRWIVLLHIGWRADGNALKFTRGATHYYHPKSMVPVGRIPSWAKTYPEVARYGDAVFHRAPWAR